MGTVRLESGVQRNRHSAGAVGACFAGGHTPECGRSWLHAGASPFHAAQRLDEAEHAPATTAQSGGERASRLGAGDGDALHGSRSAVGIGARAGQGFPRSNSSTGTVYRSAHAPDGQSAELKLLKSQLNPHFLFNSLNSVRALIAEDPARARHAVTQLAGILRYTLRSDHEELVTLERELETVSDYLTLESLRFGERLRVELDIAADAQDIRVPVMLLQTVVENAMKHGIAELPGGGVLRVSATLRDDALHVEVQNPRPQNPPPREQQGSGLYNAAERLRLLFGSQATLELDLSRSAMAIVRIRVPKSRHEIAHRR
jgi:anti-sigma regulatory factor (Ser/Thr protein kinase)